MSVPKTSPPPSPCVFCEIARSSTNTATLLHSDEKVVAFKDINPSAFSQRSWFACLACLCEGEPRQNEKNSPPDLLEQALYRNVTHMLKVGQTLLQQDAPQSKPHRFGFHQPPLNSVNHLHLHCLALPFIPKWKQVKYMPFEPFAGFIEAEKLLNRIKPE